MNSNTSVESRQASFCIPKASFCIPKASINQTRPSVAIQLEDLTTALAVN